jgi:hypothetical protein
LFIYYCFFINQLKALIPLILLTFFIILGGFMEDFKDIGVTLDVVLSIPAKTDAEAYERLDNMDALKLLKLAVEQCEFRELENETRH